MLPAALLSVKSVGSVTGKLLPQEDLLAEVC